MTAYRLRWTGRACTVPPFDRPPIGIVKHTVLFVVRIIFGMRKSTEVLERLAFVWKWHNNGVAFLSQIVAVDETCITFDLGPRDGSSIAAPHMGTCPCELAYTPHYSVPSILFTSIIHDNSSFLVILVLRFRIWDSKLLYNWRHLGCLMAFEIRLLHSHLDYFLR